MFKIYKILDLPKFIKNKLPDDDGIRAASQIGYIAALSIIPTCILCLVDIRLLLLLFVPCAVGMVQLTNLNTREDWEHEFDRWFCLFGWSWSLMVIPLLSAATLFSFFD